MGVLLHAAQNMLLPRPGRPKLAKSTGELMDMLVRVVLEGIVIRPTHTCGPTLVKRTQMASLSQRSAPSFSS